MLPFAQGTRKRGYIGESEEEEKEEEGDINNFLGERKRTQARSMEDITRLH